MEKSAWAHDNTRVPTFCKPCCVHLSHNWRRYNVSKAIPSYSIIPFDFQKRLTMRPLNVSPGWTIAVKFEAPAAFYHPSEITTGDMRCASFTVESAASAAATRKVAAQETEAAKKAYLYT